MTLVKFQPRAPLSLWDDFWKTGFADWAGGSWLATQPAVNIVEKADGFRVEIAAPGLAKEDFNINVEDNVLKISAKKESKKEEEGEMFHRREFSFNSFEHAFRLPNTIDADKLKATFKDGVLSIELPKKNAPASSSRVISVE